MADIFISYSKADREKVVILAAYLESEGWTTWWDTNLAAGDIYRDEIMTQLATARAVIVLWTSTSIKSDFVRAEAGRAKADGKLIPVKEADVSYGDIPLPFGEMHTEDWARRELIRAAVVALLAKPEAQPSAISMASRRLRYQALTWAGILGGAITLFSNTQGILNLAEWAKWFTAHWQGLVLSFWQVIGGAIGIHPPPGVALLLSFLCFCFLTAVGARRLATADDWSRHANLPPQRMLLYTLGYGALILAGTAALIVFTPYAGTVSVSADKVSTIRLFLDICIPITPLLWEAEHATSRSKNIDTTIMIAVVVGMFIAYFLLFYRAGTASLADTIASMFSINATKENEQMRRIQPEQVFSDPAGAIAFSAFKIALSILPGIVAALVLLIAPTRAVATRLAFLASALVVLIALNQLSHFAPNLREMLKPPM